MSLTEVPKNRLKLLREERKMTQDRLASYINAPRSSISMWEKNIRPIPLESIVELMSLFDVSSDYLLGVSPQRYNSFETSDELDLSKLDNEDREFLYKVYQFLLNKKNKHKRYD